jgi:hypothetical protein
MIPLILLTIGIVFLVWNTKIGRFIFRIQLPQFRFFFRNLIDCESKWIPKFYRFLVIVIGLFFILGAIAFQFGPITISL